MPTMVRTIRQQIAPDEARGQLHRVVEQLGEWFPEVAVMLKDTVRDILAFTSFTMVRWQKLWPNNPLERVNKEIRRRTDVMGISAIRSAARSLVVAALAEQHDEWAEARRYITFLNHVATKALSELGLMQAADQRWETRMMNSHLYWWDFTPVEFLVAV